MIWLLDTNDVFVFQLNRFSISNFSYFWLLNVCSPVRMIGYGNLILMFLNTKVFPGNIIKETWLGYIIYIEEMIIIHPTKTEWFISELHWFVVKMLCFQYCPRLFIIHSCGIEIWHLNVILCRNFLTCHCWFSYIWCAVFKQSVRVCRFPTKILVWVHRLATIGNWIVPLDGNDWLQKTKLKM